MTKNRIDVRSGKIPAPVWALVIALMAAEWILLVAGLRSHEMIVGAISILAIAAALRIIHRSHRLHLQIHLADVVAAWRIPWNIVSGVYEIIAVFFRDVFAGKRAGSYYRIANFTIRGKSPRLVARQVLAVVYTTAAPNFIVIGIASEQQRMLFHQIERTSIPKMTQKLGAEP